MCWRDPGSDSRFPGCYKVLLNIRKDVRGRAVLGCCRRLVSAKQSMGCLMLKNHESSRQICSFMAALTDREGERLMTLKKDNAKLHRFKN